MLKTLILDFGLNLTPCVFPVDCISFLLKIAEVKLHEKSHGKMLRADAFAGPTLSPLVGHLMGEEFRFFFLSLGEVSMHPLLSASSSWCSGFSLSPFLLLKLPASPVFPTSLWYFVIATWAD